MAASRCSHACGAKTQQLVLELDPCFSEKTPEKSVSACKLVVSVARWLPSVDKTVS